MRPLDRSGGWRAVAAGVAFLVVVALLLSTPSMIFARSISVIDTELREQGPDAQKVLARRELGDPEQLAALPTRLGDWRMSQEHDWDRVAEILNTDVLLSRDYSHPRLLQPANLLVIQSYNVSSFHPAPVCYRVQGWILPEHEGFSVDVPVANATWAQEAWLSEDEPRVFSGTITAKLLEVTKEDEGGEVREKRIALYVYLKREDWHVTDSVTWVRTELAVTPGTRAEDALPLLADLLGAALPELFTFTDPEEPTLAQTLVTEGGAWGWAAVAGLSAAPLAFLVPELAGRVRNGWAVVGRRRRMR